MNLLLHIGTEKTGTTSLQRWLTRNSDALRSHGIWYCASLGRPNNRLISTQAVGLGVKDDSVRKLGLTTPDAYAAFRTELQAKFAAEVEEARAAGARTFVISNEHMHSRLVRPAMVERVHDLVAARFSEIDVVAVLRPQADLAQSRLSVLARTGHLSLDATRIAKDHPFFDYFALWQRWTDVFGTLTCLPFRKHPDVIAALSARLQVDPEAFSPVSRVNESLDVRAAALSYHAGQGARALMFLDDLPVEEPIRLSRAEAQRITETFAEGNAHLVAACPTLEADDLRPRLLSFPEQGNLAPALAANPVARYTSHYVQRSTVQLWLERCRTQLALAERDHALNQPDAAKAALTRARDLLAQADAAGLASVHPELSRLRSRLQRVRTQVKKATR